MVWVSNYSSDTISVSITARSGGEPGAFTISSRQLENYSSNYWKRSAQESITIIKGGKTFKDTVNKDDHITVYDDAVEKFTSIVQKL